MEEDNSKYFKNIINIVSASNISRVKYKHKFKLKNFFSGLFYSFIILGFVFNVYGTVFAIIRSMF